MSATAAATATATEPVATAGAPAAAAEDWIIELDSGLRLALPPSLRSSDTHVMLEQQHGFEPEMTLLPQLLQPGAHVLDIGAHHGVYALEMARLNPGGHVWAFEPAAEPARRLQRSLALNRLHPRVTLVPAALTDAAGAAVQNAAPEHHRPQTLDGYLAATSVDAANIGFVKLDTEGDELRVLAGAQGFFQHQSPVVLFAFRQGTRFNRELAQAFVQLGFGLFRWSAELALLLPFDLDETTTPCAFTLNLVAVRPAQQARLAAQGLLATAAALADTEQPEVFADALRDWCAAPALMGAAVPDAPTLYDDLCQATGADYATALAMVAAAHGQPGLGAAARVQLMQQVRRLASEASALAGAAAPAWRTMLAHTLLALGERSAALAVAQQALQHWPQHVPEWPVAVPQRAELQRPRSTPLGSWLHQRLREFVALRSSFSGCFAPPQPMLWSELVRHPDHGAEVERRLLLAHALCNRAAAVQALVHLPPAEGSPNAAIWQGLVQSMRALRVVPAASVPDATAAAARCDALNRRIGALAQRPLRWSFVMAAACDALAYVSAEARAELALLHEHRFVEPATAAEWSSLDLVFITAHGSDTAAQVAELRRRAPQALLVMWLWDNHVAHLNNLAGVQAVDLYFHSHDYESSYLYNPLSARGGHVPACTAQWSRALASQLFDAQAGQARDGRMLLNYVDYTWSWRSALLARVAEHVPEARVVRMPAHDRSRYFSKGPAERLHEWLGAKSTLILPLAADLSTRVFDALLAGLVPVVPRSVRDFDAVIAPARQQALGIVRIDDFEIETLRSAARQAEQVFDAQGAEGARARHEEALARHTLAARFQQMLQAVTATARGERPITANGPAGGLELRP